MNYRHHRIADMNEIIQVSFLQYQTVTQSFFKENQILTRKFSK